MSEPRHQQAQEYITFDELVNLARNVEAEVEMEAQWIS